MGEAERRLELLELGALDRRIELPGAQPADVGDVAALRSGQLARGSDLGRVVEQAEQLGRRVAGDLVVQTLRRLCGEDQAEAVLAGLRRQGKRALRAGRHPAGGGQRLRLVHHQQATDRPVAGRMALDPGEERELQLVDEALPLFVVAQPDEADDRDPGTVAGRRGQQQARVDGGAGTAEEWIGDGGGGKQLPHLRRLLPGPFQPADPIRQVVQQVDEALQVAGSTVGVVGQRLAQDGLTEPCLGGRTVHIDPRGEGGDRGVDTGGERVRVVAYLAEVGQWLEGQRPAALTPGRPHHDVGGAQVLLGAGDLALVPVLRRGRPWVAEPSEVVVGIEDDRRDPAQRTLLNQPADQDGLAGARPGEDRGVPAQCLQANHHRPSAVHRCAERDPVLLRNAGRVRPSGRGGWRDRGGLRRSGRGGWRYRDGRLG